MVGFTLYYVPLNWTLMQENIKKIIPTAIYVLYLKRQIIKCLSAYYVTVNVTLIQGKYLRRKKKYESRRFGALKSDSTHHFVRNTCTKSVSIQFSQFSGCWLILSVYIPEFWLFLCKIVRSSVILLLPSFLLMWQLKS